MLTTEIHPLQKKDFELLIDKRLLNCVSIYLPMDKKGKEQNMHLAQSLLKQCINQVQKSLSEHQMNEDEIEEYLKPLFALMNRVDLWRNPSEGLCIFLDSEDGLRFYKVPIAFEVYTYIASNFYLLPLLPLYQNDGSYHLLELSQDYVKLYIASRYQFKDVHLENFAPAQLEDAVGFDYKSKMLQVRSGQNIYNAGAFHGHGEGKDDDKKELVTFFKAIDNGIKKVVKNQNTPLVVASVDYMFDIFKKVSTSPIIINKNIAGDPQFKNKKALHQESWNVVATYFKKPLADKLTQYTELYHTQKTSYEIDVIIGAALNGKIETLFIANNSDIFGIYNPKSREVIIDDKSEIHNVSLTNLAAISTFKQGGQVYFLSTDKMPVKERSVNAIFRY
tara:strand:+ start:117774 stop:118946 length:1173 start_codon:yes stop_codon:yes gene_type:complete